RVLAVAASPLGAGLLEEQHPRASVGCSQRGTQGGIATPDHQDVLRVQLTYIVTVESGTTLSDTITRRCYTGPSKVSLSRVRSAHVIKEEGTWCPPRSTIAPRRLWPRRS